MSYRTIIRSMKQTQRIADITRARIDELDKEFRSLETKIEQTNQRIRTVADAGLAALDCGDDEKAGQLDIEIRGLFKTKIEQVNRQVELKRELESLEKRLAKRDRNLKRSARGLKTVVN